MMKHKLFYSLRIIFLLCVIILSGPDLWAQDDGGGGTALRMGIKTGLASGRLSGAQASAGSIKNDLQAGLFFQAITSNGIGFSIETLYSRLGAGNIDGNLFFALENKNTSTPVLFSDVTIQSVRVPLMVSYSFIGIEGDILPYISIGGEVGFNLLSNAVNTSTFQNNGSEYTFTTNSKLGGKIKLLDAAALVGTGFTVTGKNTTYVFDLRYNLGLMNVNNAYSYYIDSKVYTRAFCATFGVAYDF